MYSLTRKTFAVTRIPVGVVNAVIYTTRPTLQGWS